MTEKRWNQGDVRHLLPAANHNRIVLKCSLATPRPSGVELVVAGRSVPGTRSDTAGQFWSFDVGDLESARQYTLRLREGGRDLCDAWPLRTLPAPDADVSTLRILTYTCGGGDENQHDDAGERAFRSMAFRRRLLARALSFQPDVVIANGDHIYWDQRSGAGSFNKGWARTWQRLYEKSPPLDRAVGMIGTSNEAALIALGESQIAALYGVSLRSIPTFFIGDDHDYFENDEASERFVTFPPDGFMVRAKQAVQRLFYPELLPDQNRPLALSGTRDDGLSENFGTVRYGKLFEGLLYDCGQWLDLKGTQARIVPEEVESWLVRRTREGDTHHLLHVPSTPLGWSAGKWREWYPDVLVEDGAPAAAAGGAIGTVRAGKARLTADRPKFLWQSGWFAQHQRLVAALSASTHRPALMISGDLHAVGWEEMLGSGNVDMREHPVFTILSGPIGTSTLAFPSRARGTGALPPSTLQVGRGTQPIEKNGFTIIEVTREQMRFSLFGWREPQPESDLDTLQPFEVLRFPIA